MNTFSRKMKVSAIGISTLLGLGITAAIMIPSANAENPTSTTPVVTASVAPSMPSISQLPSLSTTGDDAEVSDDSVAIASDSESDTPEGIASDSESND